ncbi:hypothetical protein ACFVYJ_04760 [Pontibacter sp. JAM-7]|uniref:hypothetical protein n=1 Tax=Pontibacter sp. JAM-7 TaxID=3366581 RepID=UPI003AF992D8
MKFMHCLYLGFTFCTVSVLCQAQETAPQLIKLQQDTVSEMLRFNGDKIRAGAILRWCGLEELANEVELPPTERQREMFQAFIVAGTQNVAATEIARKMSDDQWALYNHALISELAQYRQGLTQGLNLAFANPKAKQRFCTQQEYLSMQSLRVLTTPNKQGNQP